MGEYFENGSDHAVVASYSELYEEGEVEHINGVWPVSLLKQLNLVALRNFHYSQGVWFHYV